MDVEGVIHTFKTIPDLVEIHIFSDGSGWSFSNNYGEKEAEILSKEEFIAKYDTDKVEAEEVKKKSKN